MHAAPVAHKQLEVLCLSDIRHVPVVLTADLVKIVRRSDCEKIRFMNLHP